MYSRITLFYQPIKTQKEIEPCVIQLSWWAKTFYFFQVPEVMKQQMVITDAASLASENKFLELKSTAITLFDKHYQFQMSHAPCYFSLSFLFRNHFQGSPAGICIISSSWHFVSAENFIKRFSWLSLGLLTTSELILCTSIKVHEPP